MRSRSRKSKAVPLSLPHRRTDGRTFTRSVVVRLPASSRRATNVRRGRLASRRATEPTGRTPCQRTDTLRAPLPASLTVSVRPLTFTADPRRRRPSAYTRRGPASLAARARGERPTGSVSLALFRGAALLDAVYRAARVPVP